MADVERITITLPSEMVAIVENAVEAGDYPSSSEVVCEALREWNARRAPQPQELMALKEEIDRGLADVAAGRVQDFDATRIVERGRTLLAGRSPSV